jgi:hypothetical protein
VSNNSKVTLSGILDQTAAWIRIALAAPHRPPLEEDSGPGISWDDVEVSVEGRPLRELSGVGPRVVITRCPCDVCDHQDDRPHKGECATCCDYSHFRHIFGEHTEP